MKGGLPQNPGVASFPQTNTTGFHEFSYFWEQLGAKNSTNSKHVEIPNFNQPISSTKCNVISYESHFTLGRFSLQNAVPPS